MENTIEHSSKVDVIRRGNLVKYEYQSSDEMGRYFSIQMASKRSLNKMIVNNSQEEILIEGDFGSLVDILLLEEKLLEIKFSEGILRLEIDKDELLRFTEDCNGI